MSSTVKELSRKETTGLRAPFLISRGYILEDFEAL